MRPCTADHDFFKVKHFTVVQKHQNVGMTTDRIKPPVSVICIVCAFCGQVRHLFEDGRVRIERSSGELVKEEVK